MQSLLQLITGVVILQTLFHQSLGQTCETRHKMLECTACRTYNLCLPGTAEPTDDYTCPAEAPYCTSGTSSDFCSVTKDEGVVGCEEEAFLCAGKPDKYPDPSNCRRFYHCFSAFALQSQPENCASSDYFNSIKRQCLKQTSSSQCFTTDCSKGEVQIYKPNPQFYIWCMDGRPLVGRCPTFETFSLAEGCHYTCKTHGFHQHEVETKYYYCFKEGTKWKYEVRDCPTGNFDPIKKQCVY